MIPREWQFFSPEGALTPGGPHTWVVIDWDLRSWIQVTGPAKTLPDEDDAIKFVGQYIDQLGPDVHAFTISESGEFLGISRDDPTWEIRYPALTDELKTEQVLRRFELVEVDRLSVCTDSVKRRNTKELVAFKYTIIQPRVKFIWNELHILRALKDHPSFVSLHSVVIDDVTEKVLGFTSQYISGGTLEDYSDRPFHFRWLKQLTSAIDDLNLRYGIMHQDVAPRNILIDLPTMDLKIFDFDRSALIGAEKQEPGGNDVDGVIFTVYEALTKDEHYREVPFFEQNVSEVESLDEWKLQLPLEDGTGGIVACRRFLGEWAVGRRTIRTITHYSEATESAPWPIYTAPSPLQVVTASGFSFESSIRRRVDALRAGDYVTCWERPRQFADSRV